MAEIATVHLVDDDESYLKAASRMLTAEGFRVETFASGTLLLAALTPERRGCIVADLSMPEIDGLQLQDMLVEAGIHMPLVFLSGQGDIPSAVRAIRGGATDFLEKHAPGALVVDAIRRALERDTAETGRRTEAMKLARRFAGLTRRETEVLGCIVRGLMNKQIAAELGISERTVKMHRTSITSKLGVHSTARLALLARDANLFDQS
jgi:two-component system, LuxR family, response regulator FixJ